MAYSNNIKFLAIALCNKGHSAEDVVNILTDIMSYNRERGFSSLCKIAESYSLPFTEADWYELNKVIPTPHTVRTWLLIKRTEAPKQGQAAILAVTETSRSRQNQQTEHIAKLQQLARSVREDVDRVSTADSEELLDGEYIDLLLIAYTLVNNAFWVWLAGHLGNEAKKIEAVAGVLSESAPLRKVTLEERRRQIRDARQTLKTVLYPIAIYGNTEEWVSFGLNAQCPGCYI